MIRFTVKVVTSGGLHARPASVLVNRVRQYLSSITLLHNQKQANGKSILSVMALGAKTGDVITIEVDGVDEQQAAVCIQELFAQDFAG
jgi:phosphocarrier protein